VESYSLGEITFLDTPGIVRRSDTETTRQALDALEAHEVVLLVVQATRLDEELAEMLPIVLHKRGIIVVTFWDKTDPGPAAINALKRLAAECGVPLVPVDARRPSTTSRESILFSLNNAPRFRCASLTSRAGWQIEPAAGWLEKRWVGPLLAIGLLLLPLLATVFGANVLAEWLHPLVAARVDPMLTAVETSLPAWLAQPLVGRSGEFAYGILGMGPFLFVWALPTVVLFALVLGVYKTTGLVDRMTWALHPLVRPVGLSGRDVIRVLMGFGCNVPAIISTRACSGCSRPNAMAAISFGAACSYQFPATLAVLTVAAKRSGYSPLLLNLIYCGYLLATTLVYLRCTSSPQARSSLNVLVGPRRTFLQWPTGKALLREAGGTIRQFLMQALPVFVVVCLVASIVTELGLHRGVAAVGEPVMAFFRLPAEAALPLVLSAIRKDGIFLFAAEDQAALPLSVIQALTAVYLAGVAFPCLVTELTIARETSWQLAGKLLLRQLLWGAGFALILAWGGAWCL
jgi:Fe2+ transport system protein B